MKVLFIIALVSLVSLSQAQKSSGTIQYQETIQLKVDWEAFKEIPEAMKAMMPTEQSVENTLYFTSNASLYTNSPDNEDKETRYEHDDDGLQIDIQMEHPEQQYYHNLKTAEVTKSKELFGKTFLITGSQKIAWKLSNETKTILGYVCKKATRIKEGKTTIAWYTTTIPVSIGPAEFHQLPGAVLAVDHDNGTLTIQATSIDLGKVDASLIAKPKKGKKVTAEQFEAIAKAKAQEMAELNGGNGNVIIKTEMH